jgi:hypothetical protein
MVMACLAARIRNKLTGLRGICARAIAGLLDDGQGAEITPDQWIEALLQATTDSVGALGCEADHDEEQQAPVADPHTATVLLPAGQRRLSRALAPGTWPGPIQRARPGHRSIPGRRTAGGSSGWGTPRAPGLSDQRRADRWKDLASGSPG